jgi:amino-acid N-acetyltransferase
MKNDIVSVPSKTRAARINLRAAGKSDAEQIFLLIEEASQSTMVLPRSRAVILSHLGNFIVADRGDLIVACGALSVFNQSLGEVRSLVVSPACRGRSIGTRLVKALVEKGRAQGVHRVFALTDNTAFFKRLGFRSTDKATLPHKVWNECVRCARYHHCTEEAVDLILTPVENGGINENDPDGVQS